jgi:two-component system chemotaxis response regulator CheB
VVFGMPKEAIKLNAAQRIMPLEHIHQAILNG